MSVSQIDSLISELGSDKRISKSVGWIQRKSRKTDEKVYIAQTGHFCKMSPAEKKVLARGKPLTMVSARRACRDSADTKKEPNKPTQAKSYRNIANENASADNTQRNDT